LPKIAGFAVHRAEKPAFRVRLPVLTKIVKWNLGFFWEVAIFFPKKAVFFKAPPGAGRRAGRRHCTGLAKLQLADRNGVYTVRYGNLVSFPAQFFGKLFLCAFNNFGAFKAIDGGTCNNFGRKQ